MACFAFIKSLGDCTKIIHSLPQSFIQQLLSERLNAGHVLGILDSAVSKKTKFLAFRELPLWWEIQATDKQAIPTPCCRRWKEQRRIEPRWVTCDGARASRRCHFNGNCVSTSKVYSEPQLCIFTPEI